MNSNKFIEFYEFLKNRDITISIKDKKYDCDDDFLYFDKYTSVYLEKEKLINLTDKDMDSIMNSNYPKEALIERTRDFFKNLSEETQEELMSYINNCCCERVAVEVVKTTNTNKIKEQDKKNTYASIVSHSIGGVQALNTYLISTDESLAKRKDFLSILEFVSLCEADNVFSIRDILSSKTCQRRSDLWDIIRFMNQFKSQLKDDFQIRHQIYLLLSNPDFIKEKNTLHYATILSQATLSENAEYLNNILRHIKKTHPDVLSREDFSSLAVDVSHAKYNVAENVYFFLENYEKEDFLNEEEIEMARLIAKAKGEIQSTICRQLLSEELNKATKGKEDLKELVKDVSKAEEEQAKLVLYFFNGMKKKEKKDQDKFYIGRMICNFSNEKVAALKCDYSDYLIKYFDYNNQKEILLFLNQLVTDSELKQFKKVLSNIVEIKKQEVLDNDPYFNEWCDEFPSITEKIELPPISSEYSFWDLFLENQEAAIKLLKENGEDNNKLEENPKIYRKKCK